MLLIVVAGCNGEVAAPPAAAAPVHANLREQLCSLAPRMKETAVVSDLDRHAIYAYKPLEYTAVYDVDRRDQRPYRSLDRKILT